MIIIIIIKYIYVAVEKNIIENAERHRFSSITLICTYCYSVYDRSWYVLVRSPLPTAISRITL